MAELTAKVNVDLTEIHEARVQVKRLVKDIASLNRTLARLEARSIGLKAELEEYGIRLEVDDV